MVLFPHRLKQRPSPQLKGSDKNLAPSQILKAILCLIKQRKGRNHQTWTGWSCPWLVLAQTRRLGSSDIRKVTQGITTNQWPR